MSFSKKNITNAFLLTRKFFLSFLMLAPLLHAEAVLTTADFKPLDFVLVDDPGNQADSETGFGAVQDSFNIGKYKVTAKQYEIFLNSVAVNDDHYELFDIRMETDPAVACIKRSLDAQGKAHYTAIKGREDFPITYVDLFCCLRFCNWLNHGSPSGEEDSEITETGAYTIHNDVDQEWVEVIPESRFFLPMEDQWYKAAYYHHDTGKIITYDPDTPISSVQDQGPFLYWNYPTQTLSEPWNGLGSTTSEAANYFRPSNWNWWYSSSTTGGEPCLTSVETFKNSPGPYGTFDMGGDVHEWTFSLHDNDGSSMPSACFIRGGSWQSQSIDLHRKTHHALDVSTKNNTTGFRIACQARSGEKGTAYDLTSAVIANTITANETYSEIGENAFAFISQEAFEMALIYDAVEGGKMLAYLKVMFPAGIVTTLANAYLFGSNQAIDWGLQWFIHMACDTLGLAAIDSIGLNEAREWAIRYELTGIVDFYEALHEGCHAVLGPLKKGINDVTEYFFGSRIFLEECEHDHFHAIESPYCMPCNPVSQKKALVSKPNRESNGSGLGQDGWVKI